MRNRMLLVAGLSTLLLAAPARAVPVLWTLQSVAFGEGGTLSGSFVYDADTNIYSSISLVSGSGGGFPGASWTTADLVFGDVTYLTVGPLTTTNDVGVSLAYFTNPLTNAGGITPLDVGTAELTCTNADCSSTIGRTIVSGHLSGAPVPEPATPLLLLAALAGALRLGGQN